MLASVYWEICRSIKQYSSDLYYTCQWIHTKECNDSWRILDMIKNFLITSLYYFGTIKSDPTYLQGHLFTWKNILKYFNRQVTASFSYVCEGLEAVYSLCSKELGLAGKITIWHFRWQYLVFVRWRQSRKAYEISFWDYYCKDSGSA